MVALISSMVLPLRHLANLFQILREDVGSRLNITANVQYLEKALNDVFFLHDRQIYIVTQDEKEKESTHTFYFLSEDQPPKYFYIEDEDHSRELYFYSSIILSGIANFTVMVPSFLCTSTDSIDGDKYHWKHLGKIKDILKTYKPAGRTFGIELYDYE